MENLIVILPVLIILVFLIVLVVNSRRKINETMEALTVTPIVVDESSKTPVFEESEEQYLIPIEMLPSSTELNEGRIFEITDTNLLSRLDATIQPMVNALSKSTTITETVSSTSKEVLYKAILPNGGTLDKSRTMAGAFRGTIHEGRNYAGQANLVAVNPKEVTTIKKVTNVANVANVMNVASLVVGQYYMSEVNSKLENVTESINKIGDFQDREFKSKIRSLIANVADISKFSTEIFENDIIQNNNLQHLDHLRSDGTQLLEQVNLELQDVVSDNQNVKKYAEYVKALEQIEKLLAFQNTILKALQEISRLSYLLGKGSISAERCYFLFNNYLNQSLDCKAFIKEWNDQQIKAHGVDLIKNNRKKSGVEAIVAAPIGLFKDDWKYKSLEAGVARMISGQQARNADNWIEPEEIYNDDVQIIIKDGKYYYLHAEPIVEVQAN